MITGSQTLTRQRQGARRRYTNPKEPVASVMPLISVMPLMFGDAVRGPSD